MTDKVVDVQTPPPSPPTSSNDINLEIKMQNSSLENGTNNTQIDPIEAEKFKEEGNIAFKGENSNIYLL
jgi:hypothetical protein